jgi:hypothetical protein
VEPSPPADIGRIFTAPFGRCKVCKEPLHVRFQPRTFTAEYYCPNKGVSHP